MARTSSTHESVIDGLDRAITFAFATLDETSRSNGLERLRGLASETREAVRRHPLGLLELGKKSHPSNFALGLVSGVMNGLQSAVLNNVAPKVPDLNREWVDFPNVLSAADLGNFHYQMAGDLISISRKILHQVDSSFPVEAKQFISLAQFDAVVRVALKHMAAKEKFPIHVPSLVEILHSNFLDSISAGRLLAPSQEELESFIRSYCAKAEQQHLKVIEQEFEARMIQQLLPKAMDISIPLDKYYCWGALCLQAPSSRELLWRYAELNRGLVIKDSKFRCNDDLDAPQALSAENFTNWCELMIPRPLIFGRDQIYFNTDRSDIEINGMLIQKYGVMAISYAIPLNNVEELIVRFGVFLLNARRAYCRVTSSTFLKEEAEALKRIGTKADGLSSRGRVVLHDKSSVLAQLCALMDFEMQHNPEFAASANKAKILTIQERLSCAGFAYSTESIRKACESRRTTLKRIKEYLIAL